jgi:hypothetical protein
MNLVNELQVSAEKDDVLTVLRKTKRLASKLGRQDIADWLQNEQGGYPGTVPVPEYRKIGTTLAYDTNGYVPAGFGYLRNGIEDLPVAGLTFPCTSETRSAPSYRGSGTRVLPIGFSSPLRKEPTTTKQFVHASRSIRCSHTRSRFCSI